MPYLPRHLSIRLWAYLDQFPCVLLLGARQTGKSTFLSHELDGWQRIDLEDPGQTGLVATAPDLYLRDHPSLVWFDEAQRVPELFSALRYSIDRDRTPGRYVLSGSASPALLHDVSESLAGRVGILHLGPLTSAELLRLPSPDFLAVALEEAQPHRLVQSLAPTRVPADEDLRRIWLRGGYPEPGLMSDSVAAWRWFDSYVRTISERDLQSSAPRLAPATLARLLQLAAARHGQLLNVSSLSRDLGATTRTIGQQLDALEGSYLWRRLPPYLANIGKRLAKSPKGMLVDSGLLHHLLHVHDLNALESHPVFGPSWEGWIGEQLMRQVDLLEPAPSVYHWRTQAGAEVDLVFESAGGVLLPVEIKHASRLSPMHLRGLSRFLDDFADRAPLGIVIYRGRDVARLTDNIVLVPVGTALSRIGTS